MISHSEHFSNALLEQTLLEREQFNVLNPKRHMIDTHTLIRFSEKKKKESIKNVPASNITVQKPAHNCRCKWQEKMSEIKGGRDACVRESEGERERSPSDLYAEEKRFSKGSCVFGVCLAQCMLEMQRQCLLKATRSRAIGWSALHVPQCVSLCHVDRMWTLVWASNEHRGERPMSIVD